MWNPLRRISARLTLWYSGMLLLLVVLLGSLLYWQLAYSLHQDLDQQLREKAQATLSLVELEHGTLVWEGTEPGRVLPDLPTAAAQERDLIRLLDANGKIISAAPGLKKLPVGSVVEEMRSGSSGSLGSARLGSDQVRFYTVPIRRNGRFLGALQVISSVAPVERTLQHVARLLWIGGAIALVLSVLVGQFLARRALAPVAAITRTARTIGATNLSERLRLPDTGDELSSLAISFDEMLDRVEEAHQRQREFAADASHDLRIPLALIKGEASLARAAGATQDQRLAALGIIEAEADRLIHLVEDLLFLARVDRGQLRRADLVGLDELAHEVGARFGKLAQNPALQLRIEAPQSVVVRGDEMALRRVLVNLTQNALEHTQAGEVFLRVSSEEGTAQVEVRDTGCGIPLADQPRVFDRFYRVDAARSRGGAGLGLALCREIVVAHGGSIRLESELGRGTRVLCSLPPA